jgi:serine/threonine protein kinase
MSVPQKLKGRYEIKEILGQGGMGLVYRAYDTAVKRDVALKTLRDTPNRAALQLFYKECEVLAAISHPNIIEIFDVGEYYEGEGAAKPYFVMPLLPGATLDALIRDSSHRLTPERVIEMMCQACRGLQAAHERGLIHRDIKPSNLFVMDDDSVKIIDFGVAHLVETGLSVGAKGTLLYMAPEQLQMKPASPASDVFSLGVVCYEALTRRRPFDGASQNEIVDAVLHRVPPPACDLNPAIGTPISRVVHKALAKQPWNRYASAREFSETLQKGLRNEAIEAFNPARIQPRIERAAKAYEQGDAQFALEILSELEAEGHIDTAISDLRRKIEAATKQVTVGQLIESARLRFEHEEYPLALQKIQEILQLEPDNAQALGLKMSIENKQTNTKVDEWYRLAQQHIDNQSFVHAREALQKVLELKPAETRATQMLGEVDRLEQDYLRVRSQKDEMFQSAQASWNSGEVTSALGKLERVLELDRESPDKTSPDRSASYQSLYNQVRSEQESLKNSYAEARKLLANQMFPQALALTNECLAKFPGHALFQALKFDIEEQQRQEVSARIAEIDREMGAEADLDRRVHILEQAAAAYPGEPHFERQLKPAREKRDLVNSIIAKARYHEERGQFGEALAQWEILGTIYGQYPGLKFEKERVEKRREQQTRTEGKARWLEQIDRAMQSGDYARATSLATSAEAEFPGDAELAELQKKTDWAVANAVEAQSVLAEGQSQLAQQLPEEAIGTFRRAHDLDPHNAAIRSALVEALVERARGLIDADPTAAEPLIQQALEVDPNHPLAKSLRTRVLDGRRDQAVILCFKQARQYRASGELDKALADTEQCLAAYPLDPRLLQLRDILHKEIEESRRSKTRPADLAALQKLEQDALAAGEWADLKTVVEQARAIAAQYPGDADFEKIVASLEQRQATAQGDRKGLLDSGMVASFAAAGAPAGQAPPSATQAGSAPIASAVAAVCPTCGVPIEPRTRFCTGCGANLITALALPPEAPPGPLVSQPALPAYGPEAAPAAPLPFPTSEAPAGGALPPLATGAGPSPCPACGAATEAGVKFCTVCGAGLTAAAAPSAALVPYASPTGVAAAPAGEAQPPAAARTSIRWAILGGTIALVLIAAVIFGLRYFHKKAPPAIPAVSVEIQTTPPGAVVRVNGKIRGTSNFRLEEAAGAYQIEATLDGYLPASVSATLKQGANNPIALTLQPMSQTVRLFTDLADGKATLDDQPPRDLLDGQLTLDSVTPGKHTVKVANRSSEALFVFEMVPGSAPVVGGAPTVKNLAALLVTSFGNRARVFSSLASGKVTVDNLPAGDLVPEGLELKDLAMGPHDLTVGEGNSQLKKVIEINPAPVLTAFLEANLNAGTLVIMAGEDGADVYLNGVKYRRQTSRGGQLRIPREPQVYHVRVAKPGFEEVAEQTITLAKGDEKKVVFKMVALPTTAHLALQGATPGAQVFIDQTLLGTVQPDGSFTEQTISPGDHTVELRRDKARSRPVRSHFAAGQTVRLTDADLALRGGTGTLRLNIQPASAQVTVARSGASPSPANGAGTVDLEEGSYIVAARAPGYIEHSERVQVAAGQIASVSFALSREQRKPTVTALGMEGWDSTAWTAEGQWFIRRGGGSVLYKSNGSSGTYSFSLMLAAGGGVFRGKSLEWVLDYHDDRNYALFHMDKNDFRRIQVLNGRRTELVKKPHGVSMGDSLSATLQIEVAPGSITSRVRNGEQWVVLDSWTAPERNFSQGRFGIVVNGKDEVRLSNFSFLAKE